MHGSISNSVLISFVDSQRSRQSPRIRPERREPRGETERTNRDFVWDALLHSGTLGVHLGNVRTSESGACDSNSTQTRAIYTGQGGDRATTAVTSASRCRPPSADVENASFVIVRDVIVIVAHSSAEPRNVRTRCVHSWECASKTAFGKRV